MDNNLVNLYIDLFEDSAASSFIFTMEHELYFLTMLCFGYPVALITLIAFAGSVLGSTLNWMIGSLFTNTRFERYNEKTSFIKVKDFFAKWGKYLLLVSWLDIFGNLLTFFAGILGLRFREFLLLVALGRLANYGVTILLNSHLLH